MGANRRRIEAHPHARPASVIQELAIDKHLISAIHTHPRHPISWEDVEYLEFENQATIPEGTRDLREDDGWDKYQEPRIIMVRGPYEEVIMRVAVSRDDRVDDVYLKVHRELQLLSRNLEHIEVYDHSLWTAYASPTYAGEGEEEEEENMPSPEIAEHYAFDMNYGTDSYEHDEHYNYDEYYGSDGDAWAQGDVWAQGEVWEQDHTWDDQGVIEADHSQQASARRVRDVMERSKKKQPQDLPTGGATVDASTQTDITVAPPSRTPAMLDPTILLDDIDDHAEEQATQIVVIEDPPTQRRLVTLRLPLPLTDEECLQRAAAGLHISPNDCILRSGPNFRGCPNHG